VLGPVSLGTPVDKNHEGIPDAATHLVCHKIKDARVAGQPKPDKFPGREVRVTHQLATLTLDLTTPATLCVPTAKGVAEAPPPLATSGVDHFKCYKAKLPKGAPKWEEQIVTLADQFETKETVVGKPALVCTPVDQDGEGIKDPTRHLACHRIKDQSTKPKQPKFVPTEVFTENQFGPGQLELKKPGLLCLPATKVDLGPKP